MKVWYEQLCIKHEPLFTKYVDERVILAYFSRRNCVCVSNITVKSKAAEKYYMDTTLFAKRLENCDKLIAYVRSIPVIF